MTYRPLPSFLYIARSEIDGHGLFTSEAIDAETILGISHVQDERFENGYIRTPLGAFFNHSEDPNCEAYKEKDFIILKTIKHIKANTELTAFYWLYSIGEDDE